MLQSPFNQQSSSCIVEVLSQESFVVNKGLNERVIYYTHPNKLMTKDQDTILDFVSNKGVEPALPSVTRAKVYQVL